MTGLKTFAKLTSSNEQCLERPAVGTQERKERDRQEMRLLILTTAKKLFVEEGFEQVSMRRIAQAIEYSVGTLYLYFKDKSEILLALEEAGFDELYARQQQITKETDPLRRLYRHGEVFINFALENIEYYNLMFHLSGAARQLKLNRVSHLGARSFALLRKDVEACIAANVLRDQNADAETVSFMVYATVAGMAAVLTQDEANLNGSDQAKATIKTGLDFMVQNLAR